MVEAVSNEEQLNIINRMQNLLASPQNPDSDKESEKTSVSNEKTSNCFVNIEGDFSEKTEAHQKFSETCAIENYVNSTSDIEPFYVADMKKVRSQYARWTHCLPRFTPFYAVKCNNNDAILRTLMSLGCSFDCASMEEIKTVLDMGVPAQNIIYANPCKSPIHLKYAASVGVNRMTFDNADELIKVKQYCPSAELVIRIQVDDSKSICQFGVKFGVRHGNTKPLLALAAKLNLKVIGVSFHVGSGCTDASAYNDAIKRVKGVFEEAKEFGFNFNFLDIGGGFPGLSVLQNGAKIEFEEIASVVNKSMEEYFSDQKDLILIAEPGRYFAQTSFTLVTHITSRRTVEHQDGESFMYYINDGVYGSFNCLIFDHADLPQLHYLVKNEENIYNHFHSQDFNQLHTCSVWGPTCDSMDCLSKSIKLPQLNVGDWLIFDNMGAYTLVAASRFNGMNLAKVLYLESENDQPILKPTYITPYEPNQKASLVEEDFVLS
jgi:ornithine decarboxylase